ncbi:MAG: hypothetical protein NXI13_06545 [Proteobacteria bacterium]|nr:hypothetical protein [Pseudomonadota bacterium]
MPQFRNSLHRKSPHAPSHHSWLMVTGGVLLAIILAVVGAVIFAQERMNDAGKKALVIFGSLATGEAVTVSGFKVSLLTGRGTIESLQVPNSNLGSAKNSFSVDKIDIEIAPLSLIAGPLHIRSVKITSPNIDLETTATSSNLAVILAAAAAYVASLSGKENGQEKLRIDSVSLTDIAVSGKIYPLTKKFSTKISSIALGGFGTEGDGVTIADFSYQFINALITQVQNSVLK